MTSQPRPDPIAVAIAAALRTGETLREEDDERLEQDVAALCERFMLLPAVEGAAALERLLEACLRRDEEAKGVALVFFGVGFWETAEAWIERRQQAGLGVRGAAERIVAWLELGDGAHDMIEPRFGIPSQVWPQEFLAELRRALEDRLGRGRQWPGRLRARSLLMNILGDAGDTEAMERRIAESAGSTWRERVLLVEAYLKRGEPAKGLVWADRAVAVEMQKHPENRSNSLPWELRRRCLVALGRIREAWEEAGTSFEREPTLDAARQMLELAPEGEREGARERILRLLRRVSFYSQFTIALHLEWWDQIAETAAGADDADLERVPDMHLWIAARALAERRHPVASRLFVAAALVHIGRGSPRCTQVGVGLAWQAQQLCLAAGQAALWDAAAERLRRALRGSGEAAAVFDQLRAGTLPPGGEERLARWANLDFREGP